MLDFPKSRILSPKPSWTGNFSDYITTIAWSSSDQLAIATASGEVCLGNSQQSQVLQSATNESVDCLSFSDHWLAAAGQSGKINLWDLSKSDQEKPAMSLDQGNAWIDFLAWQRSHFAFNLGKYVQVWSIETQDIVTTVNFENSSVQALAWHPDGNYLTVGGYQGIKIWSALDWDQDPFVLPLPTAVRAIAWQDQGQCLVIATADETIIFLDYQNQEFTLSPFQLSGFSSKIKAIAWSNSNFKSNSKHKNTFAIASGAEITIWEPHPNPDGGWIAEVFSEHKGRVNALEFQPQSKVLASADTDGKVYLSKGNTSIQTLSANSEITCLKWHPQGHKLAVGTEKGEVLVWDIVSKPSSKGFWR